MCCLSFLMNILESFTILYAKKNHARFKAIDHEIMLNKSDLYWFQRIEF